MLNLAAEVRVSNCREHDEIDRPPEEPFQRFFECEKGSGVVGRRERSKIHDEVEIAARWIEGAAQG